MLLAHSSLSDCTERETVEQGLRRLLIGNSISELNNELYEFPKAPIPCRLTGFLIEIAAMKIEVCITQSDVLDKWFCSSHTVYLHYEVLI